MSAENMITFVDGEVYELLADIIDGKVVGNGAPAELGKRFICARELTNKTVGVDGKVVTNIIYKLGSLELSDGTVIDAGCGTEFLVTKASPNIIECCGQPAVLQKLKPLPSSD